ncbi:hypothetical protein DER44DRAFT_231257 [Fusarium oxysporum]|nr:hypothetical protein DER44DRAFT_231257 [Fusarium oxysporum]
MLMLAHLNNILCLIFRCAVILSVIHGHFGMDMKWLGLMGVENNSGSQLKLAYVGNCFPIEVEAFTVLLDIQWQATKGSCSSAKIVVTIEMTLLLLARRPIMQAQLNVVISNSLARQVEGLRVRASIIR